MSRQERIRKFVKKSVNDSVDADTLDQSLPQGPSNPFADNSARRTLLSYLRDGEQPHFIFHAKSNVPATYGPTANEAPQRSVGNPIYHIVTIKRWLMIAGNRNGNQTLSVSLTDIDAANYKTDDGLLSPVSNNRIVLKTDDAYYDIPVANSYTDEDFNHLLQHLEQYHDVEAGGVPLDPEKAGFTIAGVSRHETDPDTVRTLLDEVPPGLSDEADQIVAETDDANELVKNLNELIDSAEKTDSERTIDDKVADAESADELREDVKSSNEEIAERIAAQTDASITEARRIVKEADPQYVGKSAVGAARSVRPLAVAAPYSTLPLLATGALGGAALGAYTDATPDSRLSGIDLWEMGNRAAAAAERGEKLDEVEGEALGALLGSSMYLGKKLGPEEYAQWFTQSDVNAIMLGIENGAKFATQRQSLGRRQGMAYGTGVGLLGGYAVDGVDDAEFQSILDDDLYNDYLKELIGRGAGLSE